MFDVALVVEVSGVLGVPLAKNLFDVRGLLGGVF